MLNESAWKSDLNYLDNVKNFALEDYPEKLTNLIEFVDTKNLIIILSRVALDIISLVSLTTGVVLCYVLID